MVQPEITLLIARDWIIRSLWTDVFEDISENMALYLLLSKYPTKHWVYEEEQ